MLNLLFYSFRALLEQRENLSSIKQLKKSIMSVLIGEPICCDICQFADSQVYPMLDKVLDLGLR